jgi:hypothetical protein
MHVFEMDFLQEFINKKINKKQIRNRLFISIYIHTMDLFGFFVPLFSVKINNWSSGFREED